MLSKVCYLIFRHFVYFKATNTEILVKISIFQKKQLFLIIIYLLKKLLTLSPWNASFSRKNKLTNSTIKRIKFGIRVLYDNFNKKFFFIQMVLKSHLPILILILDKYR